MNFSTQHELIELELIKIANDCGNHSLYEPVKYILSLGGKRLRPTLTLIGCELYGAPAERAIKAAAAFEVFHNFTLMHDDIMDKAPLRRGRPSVHQKWNANQAILSGDAMFVISVQLIAQTEASVMPIVLGLFNRTALEVCEGQDLDMAFETREHVSVEEYIKMIRLKTSVLVAACLSSGAIIAGASSEEAKGLYSFGENLGIAFQLRDDYLDTFGDATKIGKQSGGDILADKKTFLLIRALEKADENSQNKIKSMFGNTSINADTKVNIIKAIFLENAVDQELVALEDLYYNRAIEALNKLEINEKGKNILKNFAKQLMERDH